MDPKVDQGTLAAEYQTIQAQMQVLCNKNSMLITELAKAARELNNAQTQHQILRTEVQALQLMTAEDAQDK